MTKPQPLPRVFTVSQVAEMLEASESWVYEHAEELGRVPGFGPHMVRISEEGLRRFLKLQGNEEREQQLRIQPSPIQIGGDPFELMRRARAMRKQGRKAR